MYRKVQFSAVHPSSVQFAHMYVEGFARNFTLHSLGFMVFCIVVGVLSFFLFLLVFCLADKPHWFDNDTALLQYSFVGGSVNISCDAMGEPPPSFTWLHDGHGISGSNYRWFYADYGSTLQIHVRNDSHFGDYKCKVANPLGILERIIKLRKGQKPIGPSRFQLKRAFTDGFELDIRSVKFSSVPDNMQTIGYRVEYMSENEFKYCAGNWSYAKRRDFLFHRGKYNNCICMYVCVCIYAILTKLNGQFRRSSTNLLFLLLFFPVLNFW